MESKVITRNKIKMKNGEDMYNKEWQEYIELAKERPELFKDSDRLRIITDYEIVKQFERDTGKKIGVVYRSIYNLLVVDLVENIKGCQFAYERLIPAVKKGAVVSIPIYEGKFVLLKQYRHAMREFQYAFPRGFWEKDLSAEENLQKEIKQEIGADVWKISRVGTVIADSGIGSNEVEIFVCNITAPQLKLYYEGIEEIKLLTEKELMKWIAEGKITDGFTLSGYALYKSLL